MNPPAGPGGHPAGSRFRLALGLDVLGAWAEAATSSEKDVVYRALFAMTDGSLFRTYRIIDDFQRPSQLFVIVTDRLVLQLLINCLDSFSILYIGPCGGAAVVGPTRNAA